jgi:hypothetical protein
VIESDHPAERGQAPEEAVHGRFGVDRIDGDERPGHNHQIDRTIAEDLVGDVQVAA